MGVAEMKSENEPHRCLDMASIHDELLRLRAQVMELQTTCDWYAAILQTYKPKTVTPPTPPQDASVASDHAEHVQNARTQPRAT